MLWCEFKTVDDNIKYETQTSYAYWRMRFSRSRTGDLPRGCEGTGDEEGRGQCGGSIGIECNAWKDVDVYAELPDY